jgi:acetyl esterase/lipase
MKKIYQAVSIGFLFVLVLITFNIGSAQKDMISQSSLDNGPTTSSLPAGNESFNKGRSEDVKESYAHVSTSNTVCDIIDHPAFEGFGKFILPLELGYDEDMPLTRVGSLLPYHSNVKPGEVVNSINYMIDEVNDGQTIFYGYYTDAQKREYPDKESTGLFFFRGNPGAPFAVVCPGGGFAYVGSVHEGFPHAIALSQKRYNTFVLQYRVGGERIASEDLAAALSYIFENAEMLEVSTKDYSVWGSSAGARMVARIGSYGAAAYGGEELPRPSTVVMAYTGYTDFTEKDPPTFVVVGDRDGIASASTMERRVSSMRSAGVDVEFHVYRNVGHGFGLGIGTNAEGWLDDAARFWENHMSG